MAYAKIISILFLVSIFHIHSARVYSFGEIWGGNIELSAFPFGVKNLVANISVCVNETVVVRIYSTDDVTLTLVAGGKRARKVVGNNETISVVAPENTSFINISLVNTKDHKIVVFGNSTITIYPPESVDHTGILLCREYARIYGIVAVLIPIIIMVVRAKKRRVVTGDEGLLEYVSG